MAGAWAVVLPILAVTGGLAAAGCIALAGSLAAPGAGAIAAGIAAVLAAGALSAAIAVGVSALVGSRGPVIGIMLAFYLAVQNLLLAMGFLGGVRLIVPTWRSADRRPRAGLERADRVGRRDPRPDRLVGRHLGLAHGAPGPARSSPRGTGPGIR